MLIKFGHSFVVEYNVHSLLYLQGMPEFNNVITLLDLNKARTEECVRKKLPGHTLRGGGLKKKLNRSRAHFTVFNSTFFFNFLT